jgi:hypothetical protein
VSEDIGGFDYTVDPDIAKRLADANASNMSIQPPRYALDDPSPDARWAPGALAAQDAYREVSDPWSERKSAFDWSGVGGAMPETIGANKVIDPFAHMALAAGRGLATLPQRVVQNSQFAVGTGSYDPAPVVEAAMLPMGTGGVAGVPLRGGEIAFGAGPTKSLFDYSRLGEVPNVKQFDLPRYIPPRGVPARVMDITQDPAVRDKMLEVISEGQKLGGAKWYNAEPLREAFNAELGSGGDAAFRKYMDMVAATSPRSEVGANARNASYYYGRAMQGEPMPAVGDRNPQPYGHMAQRLHQMNAERVAGAGWDPLNNPKPASFVENLVGNQQPVTIDTHAFRLPGILGQDPRFLETAFQVAKDAPKQNIQAMVASGEVPIGEAAGRAAWWQAQPKANEYEAMENYYKSLGHQLGLTPAQAQASAWVGGGKVTGLASDESKPFLRFFEDRVHLTADKTGRTPQQVLKEFIRGKAPLLGLGGVMGGIAAQDDYSQ